MFENSDSVEPARTPFPALRLVALNARATGPCQRTVRRGSPRSAAEWTALVKVGSGESDIAISLSERLLTLGLIVTVSGRPALTRHGRFTLGLPF